MSSIVRKSGCQEVRKLLGNIVRKSGCQEVRKLVSSIVRKSGCNCCRPTRLALFVDVLLKFVQMSTTSEVLTTSGFLGGKNGSPKYSYRGSQSEKDA